MAVGIELFFYLLVFILSIFMVILFGVASSKYSDPRIKKFIGWIVGGAAAYMFGALLTLLNMISPGVVFGDFQPALTGFATLMATVYMLKAAALLSKLGEE